MNTSLRTVAAAAALLIVMAAGSAMSSDLTTNFKNGLQDGWGQRPGGSGEK